MSASKAARDALEARRQRKLEALRAARDDELALLPQADGGQAKAVEAKYEQQRLMTIRMFAPLLSRFDDAVSASPGGSAVSTEYVFVVEGYAVSNF